MWKFNHIDSVIKNSENGSGEQVVLGRLVKATDAFGSSARAEILRVNCVNWKVTAGIAMITESFRAGSTETVYFSFVDYLVLAFLLIASSLIGLYYGFIAKKRQDSTAEYLQGGKEITLFPISMSLIAQWVQVYPQPY